MKHKVMVSKAYLKGTKTPTKSMRVWASFVLASDAYEFAETVKKRYPLWRVEVVCR